MRYCAFARALMAHNSRKAAIIMESCANYTIRACVYDIIAETRLLYGYLNWPAYRRWPIIPSRMRNGSPPNAATAYDAQITPFAYAHGMIIYYKTGIAQSIEDYERKGAAT